MNNLIVEPQLKNIMSSKGITQKELSIMTGIPQSTISRFDKTDSHKQTHVVIILKTLGIAYEELFKVSYMALDNRIEERA
jgi:transcriptional regulator with XRE-family HTH domain